jgi:hypothetical protein
MPLIKRLRSINIRYEFFSLLFLYILFFFLAEIFRASNLAGIILEVLKWILPLSLLLEFGIM